MEITRLMPVQGELFKETKERLSKRIGIKGKQFEKIKFAIIQRPPYSKPTYLTDGKPYPYPPLPLFRTQ